jgi:hypothetical protein
MQLLQMEVDADSQHTVELLTKSASMPAALPAAAAEAASGTRDMARAASSRAPSNLRHASGPGPGPQKAGPDGAARAAGPTSTGGSSRAGGAAAAAGGAGFSFKMFGKNVGGGGGAPLQVCPAWCLLVLPCSSRAPRKTDMCMLLPRCWNAHIAPVPCWIDQTVHHTGDTVVARCCGFCAYPPDAAPLTHG